MGAHGGNRPLGNEPQSAAPAKCSGGTETVIEQNGLYYRVHTFTTVGSSTLSVSRGGEVDYLVVAGGGGGQRTYAGSGGGGGGQVIEDIEVINSGTTNIIVGAGGERGTFISGNSADQIGTDGGNTSFGSITAVGGGAGGTSSGASAGGRGYAGYTYASPLQPANSQIGNAGGARMCSNSGGGGGGAGGPGLPSSYNARTVNYIDENGVSQSFTIPAGCNEVLCSNTSCTNPYYDSQYFRTTQASPNTPVRLTGFITGPSGDGGPGIFSSISGTSVEYGKGGKGGVSADAGVATPSTGAGGGGGYGLNAQTEDENFENTSSRRSHVGASGIVIVRYRIPKSEYDAEQ